jgi:hypothetical protein
LLLVRCTQLIPFISILDSFNFLKSSLTLWGSPPQFFCQKKNIGFVDLLTKGLSFVSEGPSTLALSKTHGQSTYTLSE